VCRSCAHTFPASEGGGFDFESLRCDRCGAGTAVEYQAIWDTYLAMLKGIKPLMPEPNGADWRTYPGEPITGGRFKFDAPLRCPACGSVSVVDDGTETIMFD
jgi:hypothetical protein